MNTDWKQINIPKDAFLSLLNNQFISDVEFRFVDGRTLFAHSFVLCCRSGEYYNSFVANIGVSKLIDVRDFTYEEFYEFLTHLYTNACHVDETTAGGVMKLSKQHSLPELKTQCADVMVKEINVSNAFAMLEMSIESECVDAAKKATDFIAGNYFAVLNHDSFLKVNNRMLRLMLELDPVSDVDEFKVIERVMKWAAQACLTEGIEANGSNKRAKIGNNLQLIRFGTLSVAEFTICQQLEPGLLKVKEALSIYGSIETAEVNSLGFLNKKRSQMDLTMLDSVEFHDFGDVKYCGADIDLCLHLSVSHCITLEQIELFQMDNIVKFEVINYELKEIIYKQSGPFTGLLNPKPKLQPNIKYYILIQYSADVGVEDICLLSTTKHKSKSGRIEFTLMDKIFFRSSKCIKELIFRIL